MSEYMEDNRITGNECEFTANKARETIQEVSRVVVGQYDFIEKLWYPCFPEGMYWWKEFRDWLKHWLRGLLQRQ